MKALLTPLMRKWFEKVIYLFESVQMENERNVSGVGRGERRPDFSHYLPDTEKRIERLRLLVNKRPLVIILHGPSVQELEARINELDGCDICYFGLNAFRIPETHILQKINRNYTAVMVSGKIGREGERPDIVEVVDFLERQEDNIFISEPDMRALEKAQGITMDEFIMKYDRKIIFYTGLPGTTLTIGSSLLFPVPSREYPLHFLRQSSFTILLSLALIGEPSMVAVFGGDGGRTNIPELHYRGSGADDVTEAATADSLAFDTRLFNITMPMILDNVRKTYGLTPVDIINCSMQSNYTPLRKLSYDDTFALLKSFNRVAV